MFELDKKANELVELLKTKNKKISVAESLTGGMISSSICSVSGASLIFVEGIVAYSIESKMSRLNVSKDSIDKFSAVSEIVSKEMSEGLILGNKSDIAVSTTGVAGPDDFDDRGNPKGLFYISVSTRENTSCYKFQVSGSRQEIREKACYLAMSKAIEVIKKLD